MMSLSSSLAMVKPTTVVATTTTTATKTKTTFGFHQSSFRRSSSSFASFLNSNNINNKKKNFKVKTTKSILTGPSNSISNNSNNSNSNSKSSERVDESVNLPPPRISDLERAPNERVASVLRSAIPGDLLLITLSLIHISEPTRPY